MSKITKTKTGSTSKASSVQNEKSTNLKSTKPVKDPAYFMKDLDKTPKIEKTDLDQSASLGSHKIEGLKTIFPRAEEKISLLRTVLSWNLQNQNQPLMVHYRRATSHLPIKKQSDEHHYSLDIIGSPESVSEAISIRTAVAILADHGYQKIIVDINSVGDKNSMAVFERELTNFTKKHGLSMPQDIRQQLKKDPYEVWRCCHEDWMKVRERAPQSMSFLTEQSIEHFREVLEYLETLEIPYRINNRLIGHKNYCSHTIFEIKNAEGTSTEGGSENEDDTFAVGSRHNYLAKKVGFKQDTPVMSVNLRFKKPSAQPKLFFKNKPQPKFFFIQFGSFAKLKSLPVIESLRQARIPVHHLLTSNKFIGQLGEAESLKTPFLIIMGQKEAMEDTAVVRHVHTRSQEIVPLTHLSHYLSKLA
jgi:histidyl-tRNA synthetase